MSRTTTSIAIVIPLVLSALVGCAGTGADGGAGGSGLGGGANGDGNGNGDGGAGAPLVIDIEDIADDGCAKVKMERFEFPIEASWHDGDDPFFQLHDNEPGFYFNLEAYTVWGDQWTGQQGTYDADCNGTGLCAWLVPDDVHPFLAVAGDIDIVALSHSGGSIDPQIEVILRDLTLVPMHEDPAFECLHLEEAAFVR